MVTVQSHQRDGVLKFHGITLARILSFARVCRVGVWFGFVRSALLLAFGTCVVLSFEAMSGLCCFRRVTLARIHCMNMIPST